MGTLSCAQSPPVHRHLVYQFFIKTLIIMSKSINIYEPYMYDPLGLYISLVNNSMDTIILYWSTFINYLHQHIYYLIKDYLSLSIS